MDVNMLQQMDAKVSDVVKQKTSRNDWKFVATVLDRLFFIIFTAFFFIAIVVVFRRQFLPYSVKNQR